MVSSAESVHPPRQPPRLAGIRSAAGGAEERAELFHFTIVLRLDSIAVFTTLSRRGTFNHQLTTPLRTIFDSFSSQ